MIDPNHLEHELMSARQARIDAELACDDIEELADEIREANLAHQRLALARRAYLASFASMQSQITAAMSGPPNRLMMRMPVGDVTLISVR
jgi:hypothetical protein